MAINIGVNNVARNVSNCYIGVDGVARTVKNVYIGDANGKARLAWSNIPDVLYLFSHDQGFTSFQNCTTPKINLNSNIGYDHIVFLTPTQTDTKYIYIGGVQWSKYSQISMSYIQYNSYANIGHSNSLDVGGGNSFDYIYTNTNGVTTVTYNLKSDKLGYTMTDNDYFTIQTQAYGYGTDPTWWLYELKVLK